MTSSDRHDEREPTLGDTSNIDFSPRAPARAASSRRWLWLLLPLLPLAIALVVWREPLGRWLVPDPRLNQVLQQAEQALAAGHLSRADGSGARELYQAALAMAPDHEQALAGLLAVQQQALRDADAALARSDAAAAEAALVLARELQAPEDAVQARQARLASLRDQGQDLEALLAEAASAAGQGRLSGESGAVALYGRVLAQQPDNTLAVQGRAAALGQLLAQAEDALGKDDLDTARRLVAEVQAIDAAHLDLPAVRARVGEVEQARAARRNSALREAARTLARGQWQAAAGQYQALLDANAQDAEAQAGLQSAAQHGLQRAGRLLADFEFADAEKLLAEVRQFAPRAPGLAEAEQRLAQSRQAREGLQQQRRAAASQLPALLAQARRALAQGQWLQPPGESAWDLLRRAQAIAPDDVGVALLRRDFAASAADCFEQALVGNALQRAEACFDARALVAPDAGSLGLDRQRLAERWRARCEERLAAGELAAAQESLEHARRLQPRHPALAGLTERLRQAQLAPGR